VVEERALQARVKVQKFNGLQPWWRRGGQEMGGTYTDTENALASPVLGYQIRATDLHRFISINGTQPSHEIGHFDWGGTFRDEAGDYTPAFGDLDLFAQVQKTLYLFEAITEIPDRGCLHVIDVSKEKAPHLCGAQVCA
jgi:hypothetical protein